MNSAFGVFLSFYLANDYFPGATSLQFAFVGGLSISQGLMVAPVANYLTQRFHFKAAVGLGIFLIVLGQILAGFSHKIWHLFLTQGVLFGWGLGLVFVPILPLLSQWFKLKRSLANGLAAGGSGMGGLIFSNTTRLAIANLGLRWAFIINGLISLAVMIPVFFMLKSRSKTIGATFQTFRLSIVNSSWLHLGHSLGHLCYAGLHRRIIHSCLVFNNRSRLFSTQRSSSTIYSIRWNDHRASLPSLESSKLTVIARRPLCGYVLDRIGHINGAAAFSLMSGFEILFIWMFARSVSRAHSVKI